MLMPPYSSIKSYRIAVFGTSVSSPYLPLLEENLRKNTKNHVLVGGFDSFEKYACQIGSFPQVGVKIKNV